MCVNHRCPHIAMTEHLLNLADVVVGLQQMRCKGMSQCVWSNPLRNCRFMRRRLDSFLDIGFMYMVTPQFACCFNKCQALCWKKPLPGEFTCGIFCFILEGSRKKNSGISLFYVFLVKHPNLFKLSHDFRTDFIR